jgi:hypothetical protein
MSCCPSNANCWKSCPSDTSHDSDGGDDDGRAYVSRASWHICCGDRLRANDDNLSFYDDVWDSDVFCDVWDGERSDTSGASASASLDKPEVSFVPYASLLVKLGYTIII